MDKAKREIIKMLQYLAASNEKAANDDSKTEYLKGMCKGAADAYKYAASMLIQLANEEAGG